MIKFCKFCILQLAIGSHNQTAPRMTASTCLKIKLIGLLSNLVQTLLCQDVLTGGAKYMKENEGKRSI